MSNDELTYAQALGEIKSIVDKIEKSELDLETLCQDVERAAELIKFCKSKLHATEEQVNRILDNMELN
ncbi:MAG: exodeoxyribonuclease VII small subunit [Prevotellaceae bacterium]|jgi:exodeoxyribonuclease VII small subunit|nr:exodeoxyribonuclease VII small subunit [Prevotellaceae bacterium]